ncbi:hypothetical protein PSPO01_13893 [Paraphaeosphaeria sporulosa]
MLRTNAMCPTLGTAADSPRQRPGNVDLREFGVRWPVEASLQYPQDSALASGEAWSVQEASQGTAEGHEPRTSPVVGAERTEGRHKGLHEGSISVGAGAAVGAARAVGGGGIADGRRALEPLREAGRAAPRVSCATRRLAAEVMALDSSRPAVTEVNDWRGEEVRGDEAQRRRRWRCSPGRRFRAADATQLQRSDQRLHEAADAPATGRPRRFKYPWPAGPTSWQALPAATVPRVPRADCTLQRAELLALQSKRARPYPSLSLSV